jgi:hypothetical protein
MLFSLQTAEGETVDEFAVTIDASGPLLGGGVVHAIAVTQSVQSRTVLRTQNDFIELGSALAKILAGAPPCPQPLDPAGDINALVEIRNEMQAWLHTILSRPGAGKSSALQNFLMHEANMIPPQYKGVAWVSFRTPNAVSSVSLGGAVASPGGTPSEGGIGSALQNAGQIRPGEIPAGQQTLTTPARLDSFTLLTVIGKGSFGTLLFTCAM